MENAASFVVLSAWAFPWVVFGIALWVGNSTASVSIVGLALVSLWLNLVIFIGLLLKGINTGFLALLFVLAFAGVIGSYSAGDYAAAHSEFTRNGQVQMTEITTAAGQTIRKVTLDPCYVQPSQAGTVRAYPLSAGGAIYLAMGTLTTAGWGDISARQSCRVLTTGELLIGFPMVSLAIAGLAAALFKRAQ